MLRHRCRYAVLIRVQAYDLLHTPRKSWLQPNCDMECTIFDTTVFLFDAKVPPILTRRTSFMPLRRLNDVEASAHKLATQVWMTTCHIYGHQAMSLQKQYITTAAKSILDESAVWSHCVHLWHRRPCNLFERLPIKRYENTMGTFPGDDDVNTTPSSSSSAPGL